MFQVSPFKMPIPGEVVQCLNSVGADSVLWKYTAGAYDFVYFVQTFGASS